MKLKDKFQQWFINDEEDEHYEGMVELVSIEHEKLADEHAIGFGEWCMEYKRIGRNSIGDIQYSKDEYDFAYTMEELLESYKKEKGL